jgi:hypothetical protein
VEGRNISAATAETDANAATAFSFHERTLWTVNGGRVQARLLGWLAAVKFKVEREIIQRRES